MKKLLLLLVLLLTLPTTVMAQDGDEKQQNLETSLATLETLGAQLEKDTQMTTLSSQVDEKVIHFNGNSFATLDEDNRIIQIDRIRETNDDVFRETAKKVDYKTTQALIEEKLIKDGYELIHSDYFDEVTLILRYEKILPHGGHNQYDAYDVYIDTDNGALVSFKKKGVEEKNAIRTFNTAKAPLSEKDAIKIANEFLKNHNQAPIDSVTIGTVIPNDDFFKMIDGEVVDGKPTIIDEDNIKTQEIREVYILKNDSLEIYVDLFSGKIIGGEFYLSLYGGASLYGAASLTVPDVAYPEATATDARTGLTKMRYVPITTRSSIYNYKTIVNSMLNSGIKAFYTSAHGSPTGLGTNENGGSYISPSEVPSGNFKFVLLNACETGVDTQWSDAFGIYNGTSEDKAFLGWYQSVNTYLSYNYCWQFWNQTATYKTVRDAALDAANRLPEYCPIRFRGNWNYNGYN